MSDRPVGYPYSTQRAPLSNQHETDTSRSSVVLHFAPESPLPLVHFDHIEVLFLEVGTEIVCKRRLAFYLHDSEKFLPDRCESGTMDAQFQVSFEAR